MVEITLLRDNTVGCVRLETQRQLPASILCSMYDNDSSLFDVSLTGAPLHVSDKKSVQPIRAHKAILAHASPHLHDLFTSQGYADSNKSKYTIPSIKHNNLRDIVKLIYTDNVEMEEDGAAERVRGILISAKYLIMKDLVDACETFLAGADQMDVNNCIDVFQFAFKHNCAEILTAVCAFIAKKLVAVSQSSKFLSLSREECAKFLLSDPVVGASADDRCQAAIAWLNHKSPSRAYSAECIMSTAPVDAAGVKPETLLLAAQSAVIRPTIKGFALNLIDAFASTVRKHQTDSQVEAERQKKSQAESRGEAWYVVGGLNRWKDFYRFDVARRQWSTLPDLPWGRYRSGTCAVGKRLIVMGGCKNNAPAGAIDEFDTITQTWSTSEAKFNGTRGKLAVAADTKHAYAFGGWDPSLSDRTGGCVVFDWANRYCTKTRTIEKLASMDAPRWGATAVFRDDCKMYVAGGFTGKSSLRNLACKTIDKYDPVLNTWRTIATANSSDTIAAAILGDSLYLVDSAAGVHIVDTCTGRLRVAPKLVHARDGCSAVALDKNVVCVLGGNESSHILGSFSSVEALDVREGKWTVGNIVPDMPKTNANFGFARVLL